MLTSLTAAVPESLIVPDPSLNSKRKTFELLLINSKMFLQEMQ